MKRIAALLVLVVEAFATSELQEWAQYKVNFNKRYDSFQEEQYRMEIFMDSLKQIEEHNARFEERLTTYTMGINQFSDMTDAELAQYAHCLPDGIKRRDGEQFVWSGESVPDEVDWSTEGAVTRVKNQKWCASCWAFSATGSLEGQQFRKSGTLVELSEQNLVDCSQKQGNEGCRGGLMHWAFEYIQENGGIDTEKGYPYEAKDMKCRYDPKKIGAKIKGYRNITSGNEYALMIAVATVGPISVSIEVLSSFLRYKDGVYYEDECEGENLDHAVLVVGYGIDPDEGFYWKVKNSWGSSWGADGYILMARFRNNNCGIASYALYPIVSD